MRMRFLGVVHWALGGVVVHSDHMNNMANSYYGFTGGGPYGFVQEIQRFENFRFKFGFEPRRRRLLHENLTGSLISHLICFVSV